MVLIPNIIAALLMLLPSFAGIYLKSACKVTNAIIVRKILKLNCCLLAFNFVVGLMLYMLYLSNSEKNLIVFTCVVLILADGIQIGLMFLFYR